MINKVIKLFTVSVISAFLFIPVVNADGAGRSNIYIDGSKTDMQSRESAGNTLVPLRKVCEKLGLTVEWNGTEKGITIIKADKRVNMKPGDNTVDINGHEIYIDPAPKIIGGSTYVSVRLFTESMGYEVECDENTKAVRINSVKENSLVLENKREIKKDDVEIDFQYPQINGMINTKVQEQINTVLKNHVENFRVEIKDFDSQLQELKKQGYEHGFSAIVNYEIKYNKNDLISIAFTNYTYTGGAHGSHIQYSYTFNLLTGEEYGLGDLFASNSGYKTSINDFVKEQFKNIYYVTDFSTISDNQSFYITNKGIVIYFTLYEYTPYAAGIPEFTIPYDYGNLPDILKLDNLRKDYTGTRIAG